MPKCDFNKFAKQLYWNHTSAWVFSCKFDAYFQNSFFTEHLRTTASGCRNFNFTFKLCQLSQLTTVSIGAALVDTGRKLNVHKTFRRRPGRLLNVLCTFNLRLVSTGSSLIFKLKEASKSTKPSLGISIDRSTIRELSIKAVRIICNQMSFFILSITVHWRNDASEYIAS